MLYTLAIVILMLCALSAHAVEWSPPTVDIPKDISHPYVACTAEELGRVKAAYRGTGPGHNVVAGYIKRADEAIKRPVEYPPRGGQHNQWYQCDGCQIALKTLDDTHHQCPRCNKVYTGEPYDDVIFAKKHRANFRSARDAAWAFAVTGRQPYADYAAGILKGYAARYRQYPYHDNARPGSKPGRSGGHLAEQTLDEAMLLSMDIAPAYDLIYHALSPADRQDIEDNLIRPMLANLDKHKTGKGNWQTWHNAAFITGGAAIGDVAWVNRAIEDPANGFLRQMTISVTPDGMWYENSWGYHFYTLQALVLITEQARRLGIDLWHHPTMKSMFTLPIRYTMPDGSLPRYGDDVNSSILKQSSLMAQAAAAYDDPTLAQLVIGAGIESVMLGRPATGRRVPPAIEGSDVITGAGHAILRTSGDARLAAAITYGPFGGFHGHFDKLSFVFYGFGRELGVDPGRAASQAYRLPIHTNWYRATISHNAVVVDGQSQDGAEGRLLAFAHNPGYAVVAVECDTAYKGVAHRRTLAMTPSYLLVVDRLTADTDRRFDWVYHQRGTGVSSPVATQDGRLDEPYTGNEFLQNLRAGQSAEPITVDFTGEVGLRLRFDARAGSELLIGDGPVKSVDDRAPLALLTRRGKTVWFAAVLEPTRGQPPAVSAVEMNPTATGFAATVTRDGQTDRLVFDGQTFELSAAGKVVLKP